MCYTKEASRIRAIHHFGLQVTTVIHRYGMDEKKASEVEGAVMDAYPATSNVVAGHKSNDFGPAHAREIV